LRFPYGSVLVIHVWIEIPWWQSTRTVLDVWLEFPDGNVPCVWVKIPEGSVLSVWLEIPWWQCTGGMTPDSNTPDVSVWFNIPWLPCTYTGCMTPNVGVCLRFPVCGVLGVLYIWFQVPWQQYSVRGIDSRFPDFRIYTENKSPDSQTSVILSSCSWIMGNAFSFG
jgi:hypothetical protein